MTHALAILIIALVARGIAYVLSKNGPIYFAGEWYESLPEGRKRWYKPLGFCGHCSVWLWGTPAIYLLGMMPETLWILPIYWLAATGLQDLFP